MYKTKVSYHGPSTWDESNIRIEIADLEEAKRLLFTIEEEIRKTATVDTVCFFAHIRTQLKDAIDKFVEGEENGSAEED